MTPSERLKIAGDAAEILEQMGFTAVARLNSGVVTIELWRVVDAESHLMRFIVNDEHDSARVLAESCAARFRGEIEGPSEPTELS